MGFVGNYMVFIIICAMATITLVACNDGDGGQPSTDDTLTQSSGYKRKPRPYLHFVYTIVTNNFRFYNAMLDLHQDKRILHGAEYVFWDDALYTIAMDYLNSIISGEIDRPQEDNGPCYTFILQDTGRVTAKTIFDSWYGEGEDYDYDQEPKNTNARHFTQIVWKNSTRVGFAFKYDNNTNYFAAVYSPEGNVLGQYLKNVGKPILENV